MQTAMQEIHQPVHELHTGKTREGGICDISSGLLCCSLQQRQTYVIGRLYIPIRNLFRSEHGFIYGFSREGGIAQKPANEEANESCW